MKYYGIVTIASELVESPKALNRRWLSLPLQSLYNVAPNRDRGSSHLLAPPTPPDMRVRIGRFSKLSPCGPEVRVIVRHKGFAALQVAVSAALSSEPVKLSRG